jgi:hypothetical protein
MLLEPCFVLVAVVAEFRENLAYAGVVEDDKVDRRQVKVGRLSRLAGIAAFTLSREWRKPLKRMQMPLLEAAMRSSTHNINN